MEIDVDEAWQAISALRVGDDDPSRALDSVIFACSRSFPHEDWKLFQRVDFDSGVLEVSRWFRRLVVDEPPPPDTNGLYFSLFNPVDSDERATADLRVMGSNAYRRSDLELLWLESLTWQPKHGAACCAVMSEIYSLAYAKPGRLGNNAEWPLALAFGIVAARGALERLSGETAWGPSSGIGAVVGFDGGDFVLIGEQTPQGFDGCADPAG